MTSPIFFNTTNWQLVVYVLATLYALYLFGRKPAQFLVGSKAQLYGLLLTVGAWLYIGTRPITMYMDTGLYTLIYNLLQSGRWTTNGNTATEWFWNWLEYHSVKITDASGWLTIVAGIYVGGMCWACWRWMRNHFTLAVFFLFTAFSFWGYATNGIRNGMGTSIMMLALAFVTPQCRKNWTKLLPAVVLAILACATHNTLYLIAAIAIFAFLFPSKKAAFIVWFICLFLSPFSTSTFLSIGGSFIEDHRFESYGENDVSKYGFSRTGWRWDFIIYSAMPIILGYYILIKRKFSDWTYEFVLSVYTYANAAWLLVNAVAFSNRFAYISWFLYPVVLLMPLVKFRIWKDQPFYTGLILLGSVVFSLIF